jgi:hypothetical protein
MSDNDIIERYEVREINHKQTYPFLLNIHYAKRLPNIIFSFGLFDTKESLLVGVITFGAPPCPTEQEKWKEFNFVELNRLCLIKRLKRNVLSFFVSKSLKMLKDNTVIISYADKDKNHAGYIYQATNWIYTGIGSIGSKSFIMNDNRERHSRHMYLINMNEVKEIKYGIGKHRYFYFIGNKKQKRYFLSVFNKMYKVLSYPKDNVKHYEINNNIKLQEDLNKYLNKE